MSQRILALATFVLALAAAGDPLVLHVATNGDNAWSGRLAEPNAGRTDGPFASLERARDEIRTLKTAGTVPADGVVVEIAGGIYEPERPLELTAADSGTPAAPIVYRARPGETVRLVGGKVLGGWQPVTDPALRERLDPAARDQVVWTDLRKHGIEEFGEMVSGRSWGQSSPGLEIFFQDQPMTLARWPNEGFVKIVEVHGPTVKDIRGTKGTVEGIFEYDGDRPKRWLAEPDLMVHGYWFWDWADQRMRVVSIDQENRRITLPEPHHTFGYRKGMHWYAYNILAELDQPGEWYLDRKGGILYFWPPAPMTDGAALVSVLPSLVQAEGVTNLTIRGITFEASQGTALRFQQAENVRIVGCTVRNTGSYAVTLSGKDSAVVGCDLYNMADGGINLTGGDRKTLTPGNLLAENNHIHHYARWNPILKYGIHLNGVGNRMAHNLIHNAP
ncbi:MAG: right-handed parallel beta-helix repeat-containing protein, partial [Lentisphaeria bacterium]|nr:right-handed parallel beta-helix repeat-containing protein [Lentisphaeria bacterium]